MPPKAVKTIRDLIYWQYAKIIGRSTVSGKGLGIVLVNPKEKAVHT